MKISLALKLFGAVAGATMAAACTSGKPRRPDEEGTTETPSPDRCLLPRLNCTIDLELITKNPSYESPPFRNNQQTPTGPIDTVSIHLAVEREFPFHWDGPQTAQISTLGYFASLSDFFGSEADYQVCDRADNPLLFEQCQDGRLFQDLITSGTSIFQHNFKALENNQIVGTGVWGRILTGEGLLDGAQILTQKEAERIGSLYAIDITANFEQECLPDQPQRADLEFSIRSTTTDSSKPSPYFYAGQYDTGYPVDGLEVAVTEEEGRVTATPVDPAQEKKQETTYKIPLQGDYHPFGLMGAWQCSVPALFLDNNQLEASASAVCCEEGDENCVPFPFMHFSQTEMTVSLSCHGQEAGPQATE